MSPCQSLWGAGQETAMPLGISRTTRWCTTLQFWQTRIRESEITGGRARNFVLAAWCLVGVPWSRRGWRNAYALSRS
jgi:hypothetical protein